MNEFLGWYCQSCEEVFYVVGGNSEREECPFCGEVTDNPAKKE